MPTLSIPCRGCVVAGTPFGPCCYPWSTHPYVCLPRELAHGTLTNAETGPPGWARGQGQTSGMPLSPSKPRNNDLHTTPHTLKKAEPAAQLCRSPGCGSGSLTPRRGLVSLEYHLGSGCGAQPLPTPRRCALVTLLRCVPLGRCGAACPCIAAGLPLMPHPWPAGAWWGHPPASEWPVLS